MGKRLAVHTHVIDKQGRTVHLAPGDEVPAWARGQLTNPKLWADEDHDEGGGGTPPGGVPSRSGPGSGKDAWAAFADGQGVEVGPAASRDDIIAACEAAGVITPES
jgi:hypothetical protein